MGASGHPAVVAVGLGMSKGGHRGERDAGTLKSVVETQLDGWLVTALRHFLLKLEFF